MAFVANQPTLRQEGVTEPAGDVILTCSGTLVGAQTGPQTLSLYVQGTAITSRQLYSGTSAPTSIPTEAALLVNDCTSNSGTGVHAFNCGTDSAAANGGNPTQGFLQNGALVFSGFTFPSNAAGGRPDVPASRNQHSRERQHGSFRYIHHRYCPGDVPGSESERPGSGCCPVQLERCGSLTAEHFHSVHLDFDQRFDCQRADHQGIGSDTHSSRPAHSGARLPDVCNYSTPGQWYQNNLNTESQTVLQPTTMRPSWSNNGARRNSRSGRLRDPYSHQLQQHSGRRHPYASGYHLGTDGTPSCSAQATTSGDTGAFSLAGSAISLTSSGSVTYQVTAQSGSAIDTFTVPVIVTYTYTPPSTPNVGYDPRIRDLCSDLG